MGLYSICLLIAFFKKTDFDLQKIEQKEQHICTLPSPATQLPYYQHQTGEGDSCLGLGANIGLSLLAGLRPDLPATLAPVVNGSQKPSPTSASPGGWGAILSNPFPPSTPLLPLHPLISRDRA